MSHSVRPISLPPRSDALVVDDGEPMESARHFQQMALLILSLEFAWSDRTDFYAGGNMFLYFSETQARHNDFRGPDFYLVLGTTRRERKAWVVWEEDGRTPDVIIELLSESTERIDRGDKMRLYAKVLKVGEYFLFDPWSGVLEGYELDPLEGAYRRKEPDADGRVRCRQAGLWLGKVQGRLHAVDAEWLRWIDEDGRPLPAPEEAARGARAEADRAVVEAGRAVEQAKRAQEEAERAQGEAERAKGEAERARAENQRLAAELSALRAKLDR
jgi:Uma2 family endonuclease